MAQIDYGIIDIHVHIAPWGMARQGVIELVSRGRDNMPEIMRMVEDPDRLIEHMDREGVEKLGMINYPAHEVIGFTDEVNRYSAEYARRYPDRLIPFGGLDPRRVKDPAGEVNRLIDMGIRAIKIHPPHQLIYPNDYLNGLKALEVIYGAAQENKMPVMIHTGTSIFPNARNRYGDPIHVDDVAVDFPDLTIIMAHGGRPLWMETCFFLLRRHRNVYMDISGIPPQSLLEYFPRIEEIADKTMFGSDWPSPMVPGIRANIDRFLALPISDRAKRQILRETALRVFGHSC